MERIELNEGWRLHDAPLCWEKDRLPQVLRFHDGWHECSLPADIHMPLIADGVLKDPVKADYCKQSEWCEKRSWWFIKEFSVEEDPKSADAAELVLEMLDTESAVFLNGVCIGEHHNVHVPFVRDVRDSLLPGKNQLAVRVTTGLERVDDGDLSALNWAVCRETDNGNPDRGDYRRSYVRRPQYTVGWDWGPRVVTCGITGKAYLNFYREILIREASVHTLRAGRDALLSVTVNVENLDVIATKTADLTLDIYDGEKKCCEKRLPDLLLTSGYNYIDFTCELKDAKLW